MEASFSTLCMSLASAAAMSLGLAPNPETGKTEKNLGVAKFNIDMLETLRTKTAGNLDGEESKFLEQVLADLQLKYVQESK